MGFRINKYTRFLTLCPPGNGGNNRLHVLRPQENGGNARLRALRPPENGGNDRLRRFSASRGRGNGRRQPPGLSAGAGLAGGGRPPSVWSDIMFIVRNLTRCKDNEIRANYKIKLDFFCATPPILSRRCPRRRQSGMGRSPVRPAAKGTGARRGILHIAQGPTACARRARACRRGRSRARSASSGRADSSGWC